jgi:hypothetical protein
MRGEIGRTLAASVAALVIAGCVSELSLDHRGCPCVAGWQCCRTDNTCLPLAEVCPSGNPCTDGCQADQYCFKDACFACLDNKHCGATCQDCTSLPDNWACLQDRCACRNDADCSVSMACIDTTCTHPGTDGGTGEDGSQTDGSSSDGTTDAHNSKCCGAACTDCTLQESNWVCTMDHCGCLDASDCLPDQSCLSGFCVTGPADGGDGTDGGVD